MHSMLVDEKCYHMFKEQPMWGRVEGYEFPEGVWYLIPKNLQ